MKLLKCAVYQAFIGVLGFLLGRVFPKQWIKPETGWFRSVAFEKNGKIYEKFSIHKWQAKVPDMSRIVPSLIPPKNLSGKLEERLPVMIHETCVAEIIHIILGVLGFAYLWIWPGLGGVIVTAIVFLSNVSYILIQRYNRPRLIGLQKKLADRRNKGGTVCVS